LRILIKSKGCLIGLVAASSTTGELYTGLYKAPLSILSPAPNEFAVPLFGLVVSLSIALSGAPSASKTFAEERSVFLREASAGHSTFSYFVGKNIITAIRIALSALHYAAFVAYVARPLTGFWHMYAIVFVFFWCVYGLSILVSLVVRRENAALMAVVISLLVSVFTGFGPNLKSMSSGHFGWILTISYSRWAAEALYTSEVFPYRNTYYIDFSATEIWGYTLDRFAHDIGKYVRFLTSTEIHKHIQA
jgi:ABC-type multidrug transport system permease subunit